VSARGCHWICLNSLLLAFWLAAFCSVSTAIFGVVPYVEYVAYAFAGLAMFAIYCSCAGSYLMELERVEEDWDALFHVESEISHQRESSVL
jgi:hypothetical protein